MAQITVVLVCSDMILRSKIKEILTAARPDLEIQALRGTDLLSAFHQLNPAQPGKNLILVLDLHDPRGPLQLFENLKESAPQLKAYGFYSHVAQELADEAISRGIAVVRRSQLEKLPELIGAI